MSKFKNTEELEKAYKELEREFTKKSQKLAKYEKDNFVCLLNREMDSLLDDYAKRRIADLEAKLAELKTENERLKEEQEKYELGYTGNVRKSQRVRIDHLEQQLAEKETLVERLQQIVDKLRDKEFAGKTLVEAVNSVYEPIYQNKYDEVEEFKQQLAEKDEEAQEIYEMYNQERKKNWLYNRKNQDKISFAVERLEKIDKFIKSSDCFDLGDVRIEIDNQIKQLKEGQDV